MPRTLYFYNDAEEHCIPVRTVTANPVAGTITRKSRPYRLDWRATKISTNLNMQGANGVGTPVFSTPDIVAGGVVPADGVATVVYETSAGLKQVLASGFKTAVPDDIGGKAGRQDDVVVPIWTVTIDGAVPNTLIICMWDYPSYGESPPSYFEDPNAA